MIAGVFHPMAASTPPVSHLPVCEKLAIAIFITRYNNILIIPQQVRRPTDRFVKPAIPSNVNSAAAGATNAFNSQQQSGNNQMPASPSGHITPSSGSPSALSPQPASPMDTSTKD